MNDLNSTESAENPFGNDLFTKAPAKLGFLQWFHLNDHKQAEEVLQDIELLKVKHLRTGISWADYYTEEGQKWYDWLLPKLSEKVEVLPCFLYTPPSIALKPRTSAPPKQAKALADFMDVFINRHGKHFEWVELWNEPNNRSEYEYTLDTNWDIFSYMVICAGNWSKTLGKKTVLGGMSPIDPNWLEMMAQRKVLDYIDAVGIHAFPGVFDNNFDGWEEVVNQVRQVLDRHNLNPEIWITEAGYSTWQYDERRQVDEFIAAIKAPVERVYWYSLKDLNPSLPTVDGFHVDDREYGFGLKRANGDEKILYRLLKNGGVDKLAETSAIVQPYNSIKGNVKPVVITGGAGFIGVNLAHRLLTLGKSVTIVDNLSRSGVEKNLQWLKDTYPDNLRVEITDIRNEYALQPIMANAEAVFHFAAQVAVTTSVVDPRNDFAINAQGTLNVLEAIRKCDNPPPLFFTSTNKVYGNLENINLRLNGKRYEPAMNYYREHGINESQALDFHSPYGNSKGAAEQYILDYSRTYDIKTVVFRMSCIYGPHQFGTEDQGWVAHFLINALKHKPITLYGDGKQVRDILFVEDLVDAFILAWNNVNTLSGNAFNIGGGVENTISLLELVELIQDLQQSKVDLRFDNWRPGDQKYYVSDTAKFQQATGWKPQANIVQGITRLALWLQESHAIKTNGQFIKLSETVGS